MRLLKTSRLFAALATAMACVDAGEVTSPSTASDGQPLAETFDEMARQAAEDGDLGRADEFTYAALAVRAGVAPSQLKVMNAGVEEVYDAFVNAVSWGSNVLNRPVASRSLIAWRRGNDGLVRILSVSSTLDSVPVGNPLSLELSPASVFARAIATYRETTISRPVSPITPEKLWVGINGFAKIKELSSAAADCGDGSKPLPQGVACTKGRWAVKLGIEFQQLNVRPFMITTNAPTRRITAAEQTVNGFTMRFSCLRVSASTGCR